MSIIKTVIVNDMEFNKFSINHESESTYFTWQISKV